MQPLACCFDDQKCPKCAYYWLRHLINQKPCNLCVMWLWNSNRKSRVEPNHTYAYPMIGSAWIYFGTLWLRHGDAAITHIWVDYMTSFRSIAFRQESCIFIAGILTSLHSMWVYIPCEKRYKNWPKSGIDQKQAVAKQHVLCLNMPKINLLLLYTQSWNFCVVATEVSNINWNTKPKLHWGPIKTFLFQQAYNWIFM